MENLLINPILKWVGGKRQLLDEIRKRIPKNITTYYEPFFGGGAVFFDLKPKKAVLNDKNAELMNVYSCIRDHVEEVIRLLQEHKNESEYFYKIRQMDRQPEFQALPLPVRAARILYLNKTCYNGLFRVNSHGEFNSPFGYYKTPNIVNEPVLRAVSEFLNLSAYTLKTEDYEKVLKSAKKGSFVYLDPPYEPVSDSSSFTGYNQGGFSRQEQNRLCRVCEELHAKGVKFLLSNSSTPHIQGLYRRGENRKRFHIELVQARRSVNSVADGRGEVDEVLVRNYE